MKLSQCAKALSLSLTLSALASSAGAQQVVLDFEDLTGFAPLPAGYGGISDWGSWAASDFVDPNYSVNGAVRATSVGPQSPILIGQDVVFDGANVVTGLDFSFELYYQGSLVHTTAIVTPNAGGTPFWLDSGYAGLVDEIRYVSAVNIFGVDEFTYTLPLNASPFCFGDGTGATCPCGNLGAMGEGCGNSSGSGALLTASGTDSVGADDITFDLSGGPAGVPAIVFAGTTQANGGNGTLFGDGLLCAGGSLQRLQVVFLDGTGSGVWGPGLQPQGGWMASDTRYLQGWYRDNTGPCGGGFNTSNALSVTFTP